MRVFFYEVNMKEIIVNEANRDKINAAIKEVEGKATARTITYYDIVALIQVFEQKFKFTTKKNWEGIEIDCDYHAQEFPRAYKWNPESTQFWIVRRGGKWRLTRVYRYSCTTSPYRRFVIQKMPDALKNEILEKFTRFEK